MYQSSSTVTCAAGIAKIAIRRPVLALQEGGLEGPLSGGDPVWNAHLPVTRKPSSWETARLAPGVNDAQPRPSVVENTSSWTSSGRRDRNHETSLWIVATQAVEAQPRANSLWTAILVRIPASGPP